MKVLKHKALASLSHFCPNDLLFMLRYHTVDTTTGEHENAAIGATMR